MNIYLMIAMILANIIAIGLVYQFIKKLPKKEIIIFLGISVGTVYIIISLVYWLSGFGIDKTIHEGCKNFVTYLFVPINMILFVPYLASRYDKLKQGKIRQEDLKKKAILIGVLLVIVLIGEYFYFTNIQKNVTSMNEEASKSYPNEVQTKEENQNEMPEEILKNTNIINEI